jgi:hypothetical protein
VLERDGYVCQLGYPGCTREAKAVHLPPELGTDHNAPHLTDDDFVSACLRCHGRAPDSARIAHPGSLPSREAATPPAGRSISPRTGFPGPAKPVVDDPTDDEGDDFEVVIV